MRRPLLLPLALAALVLAAGCVAPGDGAGADEAARAAPASFGAPEGPSASSSHPQLSLVAQAAAPGGYALRVHEDRAYVATFSTLEGVSVFDVSDPTSPVHLGGTPPGTLARSVDVLDWGARVGVAISTGGEMQVWELTDPAAPVQRASFAFGSHNVQVHSGANVVYNARNLWDDAGGAMEIVDASDPGNVTFVKTWRFPAFAQDGSPVHNQGCHDFTVWPETGRAYCAAYEQTLVFDVADPVNPVILTAITNPLVSDHHTAFPILDHTVLVVSDEWAANAAWGCLSHGLPLLPEVPSGALWFYDLTVSPPEPISYLAGPSVTPELSYLRYGPNAMCSSHNGAELGPGTGLIAYGWFLAGLVLVDASDPAHPVLLDVEDYGGAVGDARWHDGYVFAADDAEGLSVFEIA